MFGSCESSSKNSTISQLGHWREYPFLQPPIGPVAKDVLAARATDLDRIFHDNSSIDSERRRSEGLLLKMTIDREITEHADL